MTQADRIRRYVREHHIDPARQAGQSTVTVKAADVHAALDLENRFPAVCSALDAGKFLDEARVTLVQRSGPHQGSTVVWVFGV
jgi:5-methylcytosine-specific restriction protein B